MSDSKNNKPLVDDMAAMAFVKSAHLCSGLEDDDYIALFEAGEVLSFKSDDVLYEPGDTDDYLYFVKEGKVIQARAQEGEYVETASFARQGIFGETAVLREAPRSCIAIAQGETVVIRFAGTTVRSIAESTKKFGRRLAMLMVARAK
ncbi:cyclic nucleotide-binding domain-containing protein [Myxococcota bacterium]|nr:cyclic nucleotide-binding domain-containing protein [Myxococcota bacterium]